MRDSRHPDMRRVRIDFKRKTLNAASNQAASAGESLSEYVQRLIDEDLLSVHHPSMT